MTSECIERAKSIADEEMSKLISHMEKTEPDDRDMDRLCRNLKIQHILYEMGARKA